MFWETSQCRYRMIQWITVAIVGLFGKFCPCTADDTKYAAAPIPQSVPIADFSDANVSGSSGQMPSDTPTAKPHNVPNPIGQTPLPPASDKKTDDSKTTSAGAILQILLTLTVLVVALILLNRWVRRRFPSTVVPRLPEGLFEVLGRATLTARQSVLLVRFGSKLVFVATTPTGPVPLIEMEDAAEIDQIFRQLGRPCPIPHTAQNSQGLQNLQTPLSSYHSQTLQSGSSQHPTQFRDIYQTTLQRMRRGEDDPRSDRTAGGDSESQSEGGRR